MLTVLDILFSNGCGVEALCLRPYRERGPDCYNACLVDLFLDTEPAEHDLHTIAASSGDGTLGLSLAVGLVVAGNRRRRQVRLCSCSCSS